MTIRRTIALVSASMLSAGLVAGCGSSGSADPADRPTPSGSAPSTETIEVVTSFYPLEFMAERIGGDSVSVSNLTQPGAEPHDIELTPQDVAAISDADQVVYLNGFQPAVDDAVKTAASDTAWDAAPYADLSLTYTPIEEGEEAADEAGTTDPHFWLDPTRYAAVGQAYADQLATVQPENAATFQANADAFEAQLVTLDEEWKGATTSCDNRVLVTSHNAFGYLADRYDFEQLGITGLTPEDEPSPKQLAAVADFVTKNKVTTIYFETLISPAIAETVAAETGAKTAVLDPIEGLNDNSEGADYFEIMRSNLANVVEGQGCTA